MAKSLKETEISAEMLTSLIKKIYREKQRLSQTELMGIKQF